MKHLFTLLALFTFSLTAFSQDYYWVGGSGNWSDFATHWATTSGGSTFHAAAPASTNDVYFDASSFTESGQTVTLDAIADCQSMNWTGVSNFPSILGNSNDLNIYGSLTLAADMTANLNDVEFESALTGNTITSNGTALGSSSATRFNGIGGEWAFMDNFDTNNLYHSAGTLTTNNNNLNTGARFVTSGGDAKVINLGSSEITAERWWISGTNQTINAGTSKIIVSSFYGDTNADGPFTYHDVEFYNYGALRNNNDFNEITIPAGLDVELQSGDVFTVQSLVADGTKHDPIIITSVTEGSEATFNQASGTVTLSYVEMQDVHTSGSATFAANESVDNGNNTGWTINAVSSQDYYWVGDGGDWTDFAIHWATTSGGTTMHSDYPDKLDNAFFDANSFTIESQTVAQNQEGGVNINDMDWTGVLNEPSLSSSYQHDFDVYGSVTFIEEMSANLYGFNLYGAESDLNYNGAGSGSITFLSFRGEGTYGLLSDINVAVFNHRSGTINYNDVSIVCSIDFDLGSSSNSPVANFGTNTISCRDFTKSSSSTPVVTGTPTLTVSRDFQGNGISFHEVIMDGVGEVLGSNTLEHLTIQPGSSISFESSETQTINQSLTIDGTKSSPTNISSKDAGAQSTISMSTGTIDAIYLVLQDMVASGGATFNATQTIDNGNNTGWNITSLVGTDYYWVADGGDWTDFASHWATTSGGTTMHTDEPGVLDNAFFDASSFTLTDQIVLIAADISFNDMDWSGVTNAPTLDTDGNSLNVYGSLDLDPNVVLAIDDIFFLATGSETISMDAETPGGSSELNFTGSGDWTFLSGFTVREFNHHSGDIDFNGQDVVITFNYDFFGADVKNVTLGSSDFFTRSFSIGSADNVTFDGSTSMISASSSFSTFGGSGNTFTFNDFRFFRYNSTDEGILSADMTFNTLTFDPDTDIELRAGITITVADLVAVGTAEDPISIISQTEGTSATISKATGTVDAYYLELQDVTASGGATFNAFSSINNGNVVGWTFHKLDQTIDFTTISDVIVGVSPITVSATANSGLDVAFSIVSGPATIDDDLVTITGAGTVQVKAEQVGDIDYNPAASVINSFIVSKGDQTITFGTLEDRAIDEADFELSATGGASGLDVTFVSSDLGVATISGSTVTIVGLGTTTITASQAGNDDYNAASDVMQDLTIVAAKSDQTITFSALASKIFGDVPFALTGSASSALTVSYTSSDAAVATVSGSTLTVVGVGSTTITASQGGNSTFNPASDVPQVLVVAKADQAISFEALETKQFGDAGFGLSATATSGLSITYTSSDETVATVSGSNVTIVGAGSTTITASQTGNDSYNAAADVDQEFDVEKIDQTIIFDALETKNPGDADFELAATASSLLEVVYISSDVTVATIDGSIVSIVGSGSTTITASQAGNEVYNPATEVEQVLTVQEVIQVITFEALSTKFYGDVNFDLTATASSTLEVNYASSDVSVATIDGNTVTIHSPGTTTITASQDGDVTYDPAEDIDQDLVVEAATLTVTADDLEKVYGDANPSLTVAYEGFVNDEDESVLNTTPTVSTTVDGTTEVGDHVITIQGGSADNYDLVLVEGTMTIGKRELTAVADDIYIREGDVIPTLTVSYPELINDDTAEGIDIAPAIATTASSTSPIGDYPITLSGGEDNNYLINVLEEGVLTIDVALALDEVSDIIKIYPNPVSEYLIVDASDGMEYQLELRSLSGKLIDSYEIRSEKRIDLTSKPSGTYLMFLKLDGKLKGMSRLIVE